MDFTYPPEAETFRTEFRAWLDANVSQELRAIGQSLSAERDSPELAARLAFNRALADARYAAIAWPEEYGGRGAGFRGPGRRTPSGERSGRPRAFPAAASRRVTARARRA